MHTQHANHRRLDVEDEIAMARLYAGIDRQRGRRNGSTRTHYTIVCGDARHHTGERTLKASPSHGTLWSLLAWMPAGSELREM